MSDPQRLPATGGPHPAVRCGNFGIGVYRLTGVPPGIAVLGEDRRTLYLARATLPAIAGHPLQAAVYGASPPRRPAGCRPRPAFQRADILEPAESAFRARVRGRPVRIEVDAASRVTNRPAYTTIRRGMRLYVQTSACGERRFADRIAFSSLVSDTAVTDESGGTGGGSGLSPSVLLGACLLVAVAAGAGLLGVRARRPRLR